MRFAFETFTCSIDLCAEVLKLKSCCSLCRMKNTWEMPSFILEALPLLSTLVNIIITHVINVLWFSVFLEGLRVRLSIMILWVEQQPRVAVWYAENTESGTNTVSAVSNVWATYGSTLPICEHSYCLYGPFSSMFYLLQMVCVQ